MANSSALIATDIAGYLKSHEHKTMLRFITCGSVDDGKSTLIGRMLYDSHLVFEDHLNALEADSRKVGTQGTGLDFALLLDGLSAEREQGITIDVAYRFFSTEKRKFIVADTPGHEQYTRNMITGASTADVAVILIDARKGILTQTRRHSYLVSLVGIRKVVLAVNKMDLVDFDEERFHHIVDDYRSFALELGLSDVTAIPLSALQGDNITSRSTNTDWYQGPSLIEYLETVPLEQVKLSTSFRFPIQWVNRPNLDFRGFSGSIVGGSVTVGDRVRVLPSGVESNVARIVTFDGDLTSAVTGQAITLTLTDEVDASRGDVLCLADEPAEVADQFEAHLVWMSELPLAVGRPYLLKSGARTVGFTVNAIKHKVDVNTLEHTAASVLELNEIGICTLTLDRAIVFDAYTENRETGSFIVIDRQTNSTVGAGMLHFAVRRADNIHWQALQVDRNARATLNGHRGAVVWFTGLSGSGKSTIADLVEKRMHADHMHTYILDGDNVRHGLNRDLGFTDSDRVENIRRVAEVAKLMADAGLIVLVSFISPFAQDRQMARDLMGPGEFVEVFVDTPLAVAEARDPKGLYRKARSGELPNFTGIDSPYENPMNPELTIQTAEMSAEDAAEQIFSALGSLGILS
jgi:bifunctional enzyme CysN/CysC